MVSLKTMRKQEFILIDNKKKYLYFLFFLLVSLHDSHRFYLNKKEKMKEKERREKNKS